MVETSVEDNYRIKWVRESSARRIPVLLQNRNGPCPLLAISNALLLRGNIELHEDMSFVMEEQLIERITEYIFRANPRLKDGPEEMVANEQQNLADVIQILPKLKTGMDVNVKFNSADAFEFTPELSCLDMCRVRLLHGWLIDPEDTVMFESFAKMSYNQLVDFIIASQSHGTEHDDHDEETVRKRLIAEEAAAFLAHTSSQLTYYGLEALRSLAKENEICVFFRNNHFSTITKRDGCLYTLVSDLGFLDEPEIVWDKLDGIHGDSQFCNVHFQPYDPFRRSDKEDLKLARELEGKESKANGAKASAKTSAKAPNGAEASADTDYLLAKKLQDMEIKKQQQARVAATKKSSAAGRNTTAPGTSSSSSKGKDKASSFCATQ